jgi:hypothetical protein
MYNVESDIGMYGWYWLGLDVDMLLGHSSIVLGWRGSAI